MPIAVIASFAPACAEPPWMKRGEPARIAGAFYAVEALLTKRDPRSVGCRELTEAGLLMRLWGTPANRFSSLGNSATRERVLG
jgi:hypothetical protein